MMMNSTGFHQCDAHAANPGIADSYSFLMGVAAPRSAART
jgi:hypothetical protein